MLHKLGAVGFGGMAMHHFNNVKNFSDIISFKGAYDINPARMELAKSKGLYAYKDYDEMLNDPEIDIILVATPNHFHKDLSIRALRAGKHVICEKPVTMNSEELLEIMEVQKETGKVFTIDQNRRVNKDFILVKRHIEAGTLGDIMIIESRVEGSRGVPQGWRAIKAQGGGMMLDWGVHLIDQILHLYPDAKVTNVFCKMYNPNKDKCDVDECFRLTMTLSNGITVQVDVSTNDFIKHPRWHVIGSDGTLEIDYWDCNGKIVKVKDREDTWDADIKENIAGASKTMAPRSENSIETIPLSAPEDVIDNVSQAFYQFVDAIEGKAPLKITPQQALRVMKVMEAARKSAETGDTIKEEI